MRPVRWFVTTVLTVALFALIVPWSVAAQDTPATPVATPAGTPIALGAAECTVDPIEPVSYGNAVRAAVSVTDPPAIETGQPADAETVTAVSETIRTAIACSNAGDMARLLTLTDPAFAPAMLGVDRTDVQPEIDRAVAESPVERGQAAPPLIEESTGQEVSATLLGIGDIVSFPNGTAAVRMQLDSPQTGGQANATAWLRRTDAGWLVTTWALK
jgi:hypothetical protein